MKEKTEGETTVSVSVPSVEEDDERGDVDDLSGPPPLFCPYQVKCPKCGFRSDFDAVFKHGVESHGIYVCVCCGTDYAFAKELMVHLHREHRVPPQKFQDDVDFLQAGGQETVLCCVECSTIFDVGEETDRLPNLLRHICEHSSRFGRQRTLPARLEGHLIPKNLKTSTPLKNKERSKVELLPDTEDEFNVNLNNSENGGVLHNYPSPVSNFSPNHSAKSFNNGDIERIKRKITSASAVKVNGDVGESPAINGVVNGGLDHEEQTHFEAVPPPVNHSRTGRGRRGVRSRVSMPPSIHIPEPVVSPADSTSASGRLRRSAKKVMDDDFVFESVVRRRGRGRGAGNVTSTRGRGGSLSASASFAEENHFTGVSHFSHKELVAGLTNIGVGIKIGRNGGRYDASHLPAYNYHSPKLKIKFGNRENGEYYHSSIQTTFKDEEESESEEEEEIEPEPEKERKPDPILVETDGEKRFVLLIQELCDKLSPHWPSHDMPGYTIMDEEDDSKYELEWGPEEKAEDDILSKMLSITAKACLYCRQVKLIRVDKRQLAIHLFSRHSWRLKPKNVSPATIGTETEDAAAQEEIEKSPTKDSDQVDGEDRSASPVLTVATRTENGDSSLEEAQEEDEEIGDKKEEALPQSDIPVEKESEPLATTITTPIPKEETPNLPEENEVPDTEEPQEKLQEDVKSFKNDEPAPLSPSTEKEVKSFTKDEPAPLSPSTEKDVKSFTKDEPAPLSPSTEKDIKSGANDEPSPLPSPKEEKVSITEDDLKVSKFSTSNSNSWSDFKLTVLTKVFRSSSPLFSYQRNEIVSSQFGSSACECLLCGYPVDSQISLFPHWRKIHKGVAMKCALCQGRFLFAGALFSHLCLGTPNPVIKNEPSDKMGPSCSSTTSVPDSSGGEHIQFEDDGSADTIVLRYQCNICPDLLLPGFFNYVVHLRRDHNRCELCLEALADQADLEHHMKKHKLNHFCWKCGVTYCAKPNFMTHLFWKHGSESKECSICLKKKWPHIYHFCVPPQYFACETCGYYFTKPKYLVVHRRIHTGEKLRKCPKINCEGKFISQKLLDKHLARVHSGKDDDNVIPKTETPMIEAPPESTTEADSSSQADTSMEEKNEDLPQSEMETSMEKNEDLSQSEMETSNEKREASPKLEMETSDGEKNDEEREEPVSEKLEEMAEKSAESVPEAKSSPKPEIVTSESESKMEPMIEVKKEQGEEEMKPKEEKMEVDEESPKAETSDGAAKVPKEFELPLEDANPISERRPDAEAEDLSEDLTPQVPKEIEDRNLDAEREIEPKAVESVPEPKIEPVSDDVTPTTPKELGDDGVTAVKEQDSLPEVVKEPEASNPIETDAVKEEEPTTEVLDEIGPNLSEDSDSDSDSKSDNSSVMDLEEKEPEKEIVDTTPTPEPVVVTPIKTVTLPLDLNSDAIEPELPPADDIIEPMSPLLTSLDDFTFAGPDIPTFEDNTLPEHIIRENALFSLQNEHDYCLRVTAKRSCNSPTISSPSKKHKRLKMVRATSHSPRKRRRSSSSSSSSSCGSNCSCSTSCSSSSSSSDESAFVRENHYHHGKVPPIHLSLPQNQNPPVKRGRGRPKGSINRNKDGVPTAKKRQPGGAGKRIGKIIVPKGPRPLNPDGTPQKRKYRKLKGKFFAKTKYPSRDRDNSESDQQQPGNFIAESDLETDDSGSEETYNSKQLTEVIGKVPNFDEIWTMSNEEYLLKIVRGVRTLEELRVLRDTPQLKLRKKKKKKDKKKVAPASSFPSSFYTLKQVNTPESKQTIKPLIFKRSSVSIPLYGREDGYY